MVQDQQKNCWLTKLPGKRADTAANQSANPQGFGVSALFSSYQTSLFGADVKRYTEDPGEHYGRRYSVEGVTAVPQHSREEKRQLSEPGLFRSL